MEKPKRERAGNHRTHCLFGYLVFALGLELTVQTRLTSNRDLPALVPSAGIKGVTVKTI